MVERTRPLAQLREPPGLGMAGHTSPHQGSRAQERRSLHLPPPPPWHQHAALQRLCRATVARPSALPMLTMGCGVRTLLHTPSCAMTSCERYCTVLCTGRASLPPRKPPSAASLCLLGERAPPLRAPAPGLRLRGTSS
jgi:hypothetical protein